MTILGRPDRGCDAARTSHQRGGWVVRRPADAHPLITRPTVGHTITHCTNPFHACSFCIYANRGHKLSILFNFIERRFFFKSYKLIVTKAGKSYHIILSIGFVYYTYRHSSNCIRIIDHKLRCH